MDKGRTHRKTRTGTVVSAKMEKTVVVAVETLRRHPQYQRVMRQRRAFHVHDPAGACALGDVVRIVETRPLSKTKRWRVAEVLKKGQVAEIQPGELALPPEARPAVATPGEASQ
ncbi:MAG: 30S ribosomal protein S17 [Chloroflexi bacterium]|nr:30S ribosomal protein S17 [Chloroflexota bacterium]